MFTSKFYVDTKRNNALMVRIINNRKTVELSMGFQMDEETLANAMSDKPKPKNLGSSRNPGAFVKIEDFKC